MIIVGIDPGSRVAGFGAVSWEKTGSPRYLDHGVVRLPAASEFVERIGLLGSEIERILIRLKPDIVVVERIFLGKNADSAFKLGQARGVCLFQAHKQGARLVEYAAREVKKGITGSGAAEKNQVAMLVLASLGIQNASFAELPEDATDALALAVHHANVLDLEDRLGRGLKGLNP